MYDFQKVDLNVINLTDKRFQISFHDPLDDLSQSIKYVGLMNPPIVQAQMLPEKSYVVVSGFRRILACKEIGMSNIPCRVLSFEAPEFYCAARAIADNTFHRELSPLEQSRALLLLEKTIPNGMSFSSAAKMLGLPASSKAIKLIQPLCHMPECIQAGVAQAYIAIPIAHQLSQLPEIHASICELFARLRPGLNIQREILTFGIEIARSNQQSLSDIFNEKQLKDIISQHEDRKQGIQAVRSYLKALRYPHFSTVEKRVKTHIYDLKLKPNARLEPPLYFENNNWLLAISFKHVNELNDSLADVLSKTSAIGQIIEQDIKI